MAGDCVTAYTASTIANKDTNRLRGEIAKALAYNSPFVNVLEGGTFESGISDTVTSVVQEQALPGDSLIQPTFTATSTMCAPVDSAEGVATTSYTHTLGTKRGRGPKICVKGSYSAYKGSYLMAEDSLKKLLTQYYNTDIRYTLYSRSGVKYTAGNSGTVSFEGGLNGGEQQIDVAFKNIASADVGQLTFKALAKLSRYMHEVLLVERFDEGTASAHYRFIGGSDIIEAFRQETGSNGVNESLKALAQGGFSYGEQSLTGYSWASDIPYRGIKFGVDQRPLRANTLTSGVPTFLAPYTSTAVTIGNAARTNLTWAAANFEVAFLIGKNSFKRLVPEKFTGEGSFKFSPQLAMGELQWHYVIDNDCNQYGDFGWHKYEITRSYQPIRPHAVVPILFRRCEFDTGITTCPTTGSVL